MKLLVGIFVLLLLVGVVVRMRRREPAAPPAKTRVGPAALGATSKFHAVGIRPGPNSCAAAKSLQGQRFLSDAAPHIPLAGCNASSCRCRFVHFTDRRSGEDRRSPFPATIGIETGIHRKEQRQADGDRRRG